MTVRGGALPAPLTAQWHVLLRNEFHDILPGSSIREVYEVAEAELAGVVAAGLARQAAAMDTLVAGVAITTRSKSSGMAFKFG